MFFKKKKVKQEPISVYDSIWSILMTISEKVRIKPVYDGTGHLSYNLQTLCRNWPSGDRIAWQTHKSRDNKEEIIEELKNHYLNQLKKYFIESFVIPPIGFKETESEMVPVRDYTRFVDGLVTELCCSPDSARAFLEAERDNKIEEVD
jgi:hypothetical protein